MKTLDISLNGRPIGTAAPTLQTLLQQQGYDLAAAMACAINKQFVPRPQWGERALNGGGPDRCHHPDHRRLKR